MKFAVIAAGEGSRLSNEGVGDPKPLVRICGEPMIDRLLRVFVDCGATEIVAIINEYSMEVREHLEALDLPVPLRLVVKTTQSSMHSLHAISPFLRGERFCLTTVDTVFHEAEFKKYITHFANTPEIDGCMAVTPYVDDEKPLWVGVKVGKNGYGRLEEGASGRMLVTGFHDAREDGDSYVSGGIYCLDSRALDVLDRCLDVGMSRMRNFQRKLVEEGLCLEAYPINKILDVDHKDDIVKAEAFLHPLEGKRIVGVCRGEDFSPNCVDKDAAIMYAVKGNLELLGAEVSLTSETDLSKNAERLANNTGCPDALFSMARSSNALDVLRLMEQSGCVVVNRSDGVESCVRRKMVEMFSDGGIRYPESRIIEKGTPMAGGMTYPCWLKRGDGCAQCMEDTCYVHDEEEACKSLERFWQRGISSVVVNEHLRGDLIKFYGVQETGFFFWLYPSRCSHHSKFGLEAINGEVKGTMFDEEELKREANKAADILGVSVYGGDCIIADDGSFKIIDFNDWPSFAPCREEAAFQTAKAICHRMLSDK